MFSPYYAFARRGGGGDPDNHCALNVALYGPKKRWCMTERGRRSLFRDADCLTIGDSGLRWDGAVLDISIDETTVPLPSRLRGTVRLTPSALTGRSYALDAGGNHHWRPIAPCGRIEVKLEKPGLNWTGSAYWDSNVGDRPLEDDFFRWDWSRLDVSTGAAVFYDASRRDGGNLSLALRFDNAGNVTSFAPPPAQPLPTTAWGVKRGTRADAGFSAKIMQTLENAPFYARSVIATRVGGETVRGVHESLSLDRFKAPWVRMLLPFRMPRRTKIRRRSHS